MAKKRLKIPKIFLTYWREILLLLVIFLRIPSLFEPFTYGDEGIYITLGQAARKGLVWYRDIHDNKPPLLYLLAALAGSFEYFRLILFLWSLATIFLFYRLCQAVFNKNEQSIIFSTFLFAVLTSLHCFEGNVANAENFMMLLTIGAIILILRGLDLSGWRRTRPSKPPQRLSVPTSRRDLSGFSLFFLSGILFSLATLFKVPAAFDFIAALVFIFLIFISQKKKNFPLSTFHFPLLFIGFLLPLLTTIIYYTSKNALSQYLSAAFFQNLPYLSSWSSGQPQASGLPLALLGRLLLVFFLIVLLFFWRKHFSFSAKLILVWFAFSWLAALLSSRPYPHYLLQTLPPLCLSVGLIFYSQIKNSREKIIPLALLAVLALTFILFKFWWYENISYYLNFYEYALGGQTRQEYLLKFDPQAERIYQTADYLKNHTLPGEKIFIWGNDPFLYALTGRLPVGHYTVAYHIVDFNGYQQTIDALIRDQPRYLLVTGSESRPFPELEAFIQNYYLPEARIQDISIFHRRPFLAHF